MIWLLIRFLFAPAPPEPESSLDWELRAWAVQAWLQRAIALGIAAALLGLVVGRWCFSTELCLPPLGLL